MTTETNGPSETVEIKRKRGRPPGSKTRSQGNGDARDAEIANLREQLSAMAKGQAPLAPAPVASGELQPGSLVVVGKDGNGADIFAKVRYSRDWLIKHSPSIRWVPSRTTTVSPHGIPWALEAGVEIDTPQIVKGIFDQSLEAERLEALRNRPLSLQEKSDLDNRAATATGKHWSRLFRLSQTGLGVRDTDSGEEGI